MNDLNGKRVLITGATGLIGSHLTERLLSEGAEVIAVGRSLKRLESTFPSPSEKLILCENDISAAFPEGTGKLDFIFHAASPISGAEIREYPVNTINANLNGCINCLEYLRKQGSGRMIVFSSATVYGGVFAEDTSVSEECTCTADALHTANTPYSESKRMIEVIARSYNIQYGTDAVIVRIGYVYGHTSHMPATAFYEFIGNAVSGQNIVMNGSGMGRRDNIHVDDVVNGLIAAALKGSAGEAYNISSNGDKGNFRAMDEIAPIIADAANKLYGDSRIKAVIKPFEGSRKPGLMLNNTKLRDLGWNISVSLEDGIADTVKKFFR